jgi:DNA-directed RNA polymerase II subunit RPB2
MSSPLFPGSLKPGEKENSFLAEKPQLDRGGKLLTSLFAHQGVTSDIASYNDAIDSAIPKIIESSTIEIGEYTLKFINPMYNNTGTPSNPDTPLDARTLQRSYELDLRATVVLMKDNKILPRVGNVVGEPIKLTAIPLMLGSNRCVTKGKSSKELQEMGECPNDLLAYFIMKGTMRYLLYLDRLRVNFPFVYHDSKEKQIVCKMTCESVGTTSTSLVTIVRNKRGVYKIKFTGSAKKINIFAVMDVLFRAAYDGQPINEEYAFLFIQHCLPPNIISNEYSKTKIIASFYATWTKYLEQHNHSLYDYVVKKLSSIGIVSEETRIPVILSKIMAGVYPQLGTSVDNKKPSYDRLYLLAFQASTLSRYFEGYRPIDNRDAWINKRLESPGRSISTLFAKMFDSSSREIEADVTKSIRGEVTYENIEKIIQLKMSSICTAFTNSFVTNNWGTPTSKQKEPITEIVPENPIARLTLRTKIVTPNSKHVRKIDTRMVRTDQVGGICVVQTPEGQGCGLTKHIALTSKTTTFSPDASVFSAINKFISKGNINQNHEYGSSFVMVNGKFFGWLPGDDLRKFLIHKRRVQEIPENTEITLEYTDNVLYIYTDGSRVLRPLLIVDDDDKLVIEKENLWDETFPVLLSRKAVEYIGLREQAKHVVIAQSIDFFHEQKLEKELHRSDIIKITEEMKSHQQDTDEWISLKDSLIASEKSLEILIQFKSYTHCEIDPQAILGISAAHVPFPHMNQGPRNTYQCNMGGQSSGVGHTNHGAHFPTTLKMMTGPTKPLVSPMINRVSGLDEMPTGDTALIAITTYGGMNQEDSIIMNESSLDLGKFRSIVYRTIKVDLKDTLMHKMVIGIPPDSNPEKFKHLNLNGLPKVGSTLDVGDIVIGCYRVSINNSKIEDCSEKIPIGSMPSVVDTVRKSDRATTGTIVKVKLREVRIPKVGDKFALRHAQKGTIGFVMKNVDMPVIQSGPMMGVTPDIIFNPHGLPSRMTMGMVIELMLGPIASLKGHVDATAFRDLDVNGIRDELKKYGFNPSGRVSMLNGMTGEIMDSTIFVGPAYYQVLKHMVDDKLQARATGLVNNITRKPVGGRSLQGGLRIGEMERDGLFAHGAIEIAYDRLITQSSPYTSVFCSICGTMAAGSYVKQEYECECTRSGKPGKFVQNSISNTLVVVLHHFMSSGIKMSFIQDA